MSLVFVPLSRAELAAWAHTGSWTPPAGFAVTAGLARAFGFGPDDAEDAEYTALHIAGLAGLLAGGERLVAVAAAVADGSDEFGHVTLGALPFGAVTAVFTEGSADLAAGVREALSGSSLSSAWDDHRVETLLAEGSLLWHDVSEWGTLV